MTTLLPFALFLTVVQSTETSSARSVSPIPSTFVSYGLVGDKSFQGDNIFKFSFGGFSLPFYGSHNREAFVANDGYITFSEALWTSNSSGFLTPGHPFIAPFFTHLFQPAGGSLWVSTLAPGSSRLSDVNSKFQVDNVAANINRAVVVTFDNISPFGYTYPGAQNSFQLVWGADASNNEFYRFCYGVLQFPGSAFLSVLFSERWMLPDF